MFVIRRKGKSPAATKEKAPRPAVKSSEYHSVSIKLSSKSCTAAKEMTGQRFLSIDAPALPLPGCDIAECGCRFVHHKDRRDPADRRSPFNSSINVDSGTFKKEQRERRDDRRDDAREDDLF
jgi:hypothetical protein